MEVILTNFTGGLTIGGTEFHKRDHDDIDISAFISAAFPEFKPQNHCMKHKLSNILKVEVDSLMDSGDYNEYQLLNINGDFFDEIEKDVDELEDGSKFSKKAKKKFGAECVYPYEGYIFFIKTY